MQSVAKPMRVSSCSRIPMRRGVRVYNMQAFPVLGLSCRMTRIATVLDLMEAKRKEMITVEPRVSTRNSFSAACSGFSPTRPTVQALTSLSRSLKERPMKTLCVLHCSRGFNKKSRKEQTIGVTDYWHSIPKKNSLISSAPWMCRSSPSTEPLLIYQLLMMCHP